MRRDDRIRVAGPNGSGKTSLLDALLRRATIPAECMLVLQQEATSEQEISWIHAVRELPAANRGRVLSLVSLLGSDPAAPLASDLPSPGEVGKLALARGIGTDTWLLVLDEPTNHLDLPSIQRLEASLWGYQGALVIVTHDDDLAAAVATTTWEIGPDDGLTQRMG